MNEVFSKLARDAMVERASGFREFDANLFAELIVKDCLAQVKEVVIPITSDAIEDRIKHHFGIEE